jgi:hypothetical protein
MLGLGIIVWFVERAAVSSALEAILAAEVSPPLGLPPTPITPALPGPMAQ